ncbi:S8 family serine peptidase [Hymenobacter setariae]|uniref:S8 family serine peptidase n=1 Tax=Hymenobacter setariae TaxID=2594794 RepID=A0A558C2N5_9BACT|nr:S8 family serine peptidase [Hymenobacter setariae]TVT42947.1 S8 family serine peptidase [Hymenobacter setariae]
MRIRVSGRWPLVGWLCLLPLALAARAASPTPGLAAPARYWVSFADKAGVAFNPTTYFSPAAQARRRRQGLPAFETTDLPVRPDYLARVRAGCDTLTLVSRWFNAAACRATPAQAAALRQLPGVLRVVPWPEAAGPAALAARPVVAPRVPSRRDELSTNDYLLARQQTAVLGRAAFGRAGLTGRGVRIAVFDVGYNGVETHPAFAALRREKRIAATYDFLKNRVDVFRTGSHGTEVLGCLAGRLPGRTEAASDSLAAGPTIGLAPDATYLLARTESLSRERIGEEEAWLRAAEWADREGADIVSSSLAYTAQRYFPEWMDGRHSLIARAANIAARKGMLVVSAAGNDGDDDWGRIGTPADADSALAVGGLDPATGLHVAFSSTGPSADRRLKPDVSAFGIVLTTTPGGYERLEGTSFSAPLVAGFAACVWQQQRRLGAMEVFRQVRASSELYPYYDYAHGYGQPRAEYFTAPTTAKVKEPTFDFVAHDSVVVVVLRPAATLPTTRALPLLTDPDEAGLAWLATLGPAVGSAPAGAAAPTSPPDAAPVGQEKPTADTNAPLPPAVYPPRLYWHLANPRGVLHRYEVRAVAQRVMLQLPRRLLHGGTVLRVHYQGYTGEYSEK